MTFRRAQTESVKVDRTDPLAPIEAKCKNCRRPISWENTHCDFCYDRRAAEEPLADTLAGRF